MVAGPVEGADSAGMTCPIGATAEPGALAIEGAAAQEARRLIGAIESRRSVASRQRARVNTCRTAMSGQMPPRSNHIAIAN